MSAYYLREIPGITLVALIITIIILLILATVSINLIINNEILDKAKSAIDKYSEGEIEEQIKIAYSEWQTARWDGTSGDAKDFVKNRLKDTFNLQDNEIEVEVEDDSITVIMNGKEYTYTISNGNVTSVASTRIKKSTAKEDSYVGCYADIDKDGTVDGVIFVDLLTGSIRDTQQWMNNYGSYTITTDGVTIENVKSYYISQESYTDSCFGTHSVISPKGSGEKRFYIMQLNNFITPAKTDGTESENYPEFTTYTWYKNAYEHMNPVITSNDFGTGRENTRKMIAKWNAAGTSEGYTDSPQNNRDIWKHIQAKYNAGWFLPSIKEWGAFASELGIIGGNNGNWKLKGLSDLYWTSSQNNANIAWGTQFNYGSMVHKNVNMNWFVRLATTF